ncbi:MAG: hypothetical protein ACHQHP_04775 [Bacteroidia bacterium]
MIVYCTYSFNKEISHLQKNNSYTSILDDVLDYFKDKDINELHQTRDIIQNVQNKYSLNKYRIANSTMNKGKRSSYRCICACFLAENKIVIGKIYPKTGSDGFDNLSKEEYKSIAKEILQALKEKALFILDIGKRQILTNRN